MSAKKGISTRLISPEMAGKDVMISLSLSRPMGRLADGRGHAGHLSSSLADITIIDETVLMLLPYISRLPWDIEPQAPEILVVNFTK